MCLERGMDVRFGVYFFVGRLKDVVFSESLFFVEGGVVFLIGVFNF